MANIMKNRSLAIMLYIIPILVVTALTKTVFGFLLSAGIMTILLGLSFKHISSYIGLKNDVRENKGSIFIAVSGILLIILAMM